MYKSAVKPAMLYGMETMAVMERQVGKMKVANGEVDAGSDKKEQDKKRIRERDCKNCKVRRQTLECKASLVWTREKERRRLRGKNHDGDGGVT